MVSRDKWFLSNLVMINALPSQCMVDLVLASGRGYNTTSSVLQALLADATSKCTLA